MTRAFFCLLALLLIGFTAFSREIAGAVGTGSAVQERSSLEEVEALEKVVVRGKCRHRVDSSALFKIEPGY